MQKTWVWEEFGEELLSPTIMSSYEEAELEDLGGRLTQIVGRGL